MDGKSSERALKVLQKTVHGEDFDRWRHVFFSKYAEVFTCEEENKLEYTTIHHLYEQGLEERFAAALSASQIRLEDLETTLLSSQSNSLVDGLDAAAIEALHLILERSDFIAFKATMLLERERQRSTEVANIGSLDQLCNPAFFQIDALPDVASDINLLPKTGGWTIVLDADWIKFEYQPARSSGKIFARGAWTVDMTVVECCDMLLTHDDRRTSWDAHFRGAVVEKGDSFNSDDIVLRVTVDMGTFVHWVGVPRENCFRSIRLWNHPFPGSVTLAALPWDVKRDQLDDESGFLKWNMTTVRPHPVDKGKSIIAVFGKVGVGCLPTWAIIGALSKIPQRMAKGLESRYITNVREKGDVVDLTPVDFRGCES